MHAILKQHQHKLRRRERATLEAPPEPPCMVDSALVDAAGRCLRCGADEPEACTSPITLS